VLAITIALGVDQWVIGDLGPQADEPTELPAFGSKLAQTKIDPVCEGALGRVLALVVAFCLVCVQFSSACCR